MDGSNGYGQIRHITSLFLSQHATNHSTSRGTADDGDKEKGSPKLYNFHFDVSGIVKREEEQRKGQEERKRKSLTNFRDFAGDNFSDQRPSGYLASSGCPFSLPP